MEEKSKKMDKKTKAEWDDLYSYIRTDILNILGYDTKKSLPKHLVLRLKGLYDGKFMANKNSKPKARYEFSEILLTFKFCKFDIHNAIRSNTFTNENHMVNYIMVIIESKINDIVDILERKRKSEEKTQEVNIEINDKADYKPKTKEIVNNRLKDLW